MSAHHESLILSGYGPKLRSEVPGGGPCLSRHEVKPAKSAEGKHGLKEALEGCDVDVDEEVGRSQARSTHHCYDILQPSALYIFNRRRETTFQVCELELHAHRGMHTDTDQMADWEHCVAHIHT